MMRRNSSHIRPELRGLPLEGFVILYRVTNDLVEIMKIVSGKRDLDTLFSNLNDGY